MFIGWGISCKIALVNSSIWRLYHFAQLTTNGFLPSHSYLTGATVTISKCMPICRVMYMCRPTAPDRFSNLNFHRPHFYDNFTAPTFSEFYRPHIFGHDQLILSWIKELDDITHFALPNLPPPFSDIPEFCHPYFLYFWPPPLFGVGPQICIPPPTPTPHPPPPPPLGLQRRLSLAEPIHIMIPGMWSWRHVWTMLKNVSIIN